MAIVCRTQKQIIRPKWVLFAIPQTKSGRMIPALFGIHKTRPDTKARLYLAYHHAKQGQTVPFSRPFRADPYRVKQAANTTRRGTRAHCIRLWYVQALRDHPLIALCAACYAAIASSRPDSFILSCRPWLAQNYHNGMQSRAAGGYPRLFALQL